MSVLIPRTRTISVRLSEEEFAALEKHCAESGSRSLSDLARSALCGLLGRSSQGNVLAVADGYSAQMRELEQKVEKMRAEIAMLRATTQPYL
ncbi:MAG: ribbon-helix-helix protein, CopG family [Terracidiphilus sp.]|jgi:Ribbon-helix-helix protein, copG family